MTFYISTSGQCLGMSHSGAVYTDGGLGTVTLTDEQVARLVALIREHDGETDIEELQLEEVYPDIYEALDDAYREVAYQDEYRYWLFEGFANGVFDEPDGFMTTCEEKYGFKFEPEDMDEYLDEDGELDEDHFEEDKEEYFHEWLDEYTNSLDEDELEDFIHENYGDDLVNMNGFEYTVEIPDDICSMAEQEEEDN